MTSKKVVPSTDSDIKELKKMVRKLSKDLKDLAEYVKCLKAKEDLDSGAKTLNEVRKDLNLPQLEQGDIHIGRNPMTLEEARKLLKMDESDLPKEETGSKRSCCPCNRLLGSKEPVSMYHGWSNDGV